MLKLGATYTTVDTPTVDDFTTYDFVYQGGHIYYISDAESLLLIAAGYTILPDIYLLYPLLTLFPDEQLFPGFQFPVDYPG